MSADSKSSKTQIVVAIIGLIGVLGGALFANWDKVYPPQEKTKQVNPYQNILPIRSAPLAVSETEFERAFKLDKNGHPLKYIKNNFKEQTDVVIDRTTGLMWQKLGSYNSMSYKKAQGYVEKLNRDSFVGYTDWRLPTIPELISLLESEKQSNDLYINPVFGNKQQTCWSCDTVKGSVNLAWDINFRIGRVRPPRSHNYFVRVVRAGQ